MLTQVDRILASKRPRRLLFQHVGKFLSKDSPDYKAIEDAYGSARKVCANRMREDGSRAFGHGRTVCLIGVVCLGIRDPALIQAMLQHDVVEDIDGWTHERIEATSGQAVAYFIRWLSKPHPKLFTNKLDRDEFYCKTFEDAPRNILLGKLPDVLHNLLTLFACSLEKQRRIVGVARRVYLPLARKHNILVLEMPAAIARVEARWPAAEVIPLEKKRSAA
jgi:(p)ppGpp synthase/HD superfamily hydrolase